MKYRIFALLIVFVIWQLLRSVNTFLIPSPFDVALALPRLLLDVSVLGDIGSTLLRILEAFAISVCLAIPVGLILGRFKKVYLALSFLFDFFRSTPATAIFPLFLILFGVGDVAKILSASFAAFLIITFSLAEGIRHVSLHKMLAVKVMGATHFQTIQKIIFWESLPHLFIGLRNGISTAMIVIVVTEMFVGTVSGVGKKIVDFQITYEIASVYAMVLIVGALGYVVNKCIFLLERKIVHWHNR